MKNSKLFNTLLSALLTVVFILPTVQARSKAEKTSASLWDRQFYQTYNHTNYTKFKPFYNVIDYNKFDAPLANAICLILTNEQRVKNQLEALPFALELETAAYHHSLKMATTKFYSHNNSKDASRATPELRAKLAGISNPFIAENIYDHYMKDGDTYYSMAQKLVDGWMKSPGHRSNILSKSGKAMGCGIYFEGEWSSNRSYKQIKATQNFQWFKDIIAGPSQDKAP